MKKIFYFLSLISILTFSSCTIGGTYYLINQTGEDLIIKFEYEDNRKNAFRNNSGIRTMKYNGRKIKPRKIDRMKKVEIEYDSTDGSFQFFLAKGEFAFIGAGRNYYDYYKFFGLKKISAKGENTLIELDKNQIDNKVKIKTRTGGFLHYVQTYTLINN